MCMFVICMLCTEKRKDAGGFANKSVTTMPVTKKRHSTSASYSSAVSTTSTSSSASTGSAANCSYGPAIHATTTLGAATLMPFRNATCNIMGATTAPAQALPHITPPLASIKYNLVQKTVSPAVVFQELPPRYRAWL